MAIPGIQVINVGLQNESANSDSLYTAFTKTKTNFSTLFACSSPYNTFTANAGIGVTANSTAGTVDIINTGVLNIIPGTGVSINQSNGNVTISSIGGGNGGGIGTVTSVGIAPVSSQRLVVTNSPVVSSGNISLDLAQTGVAGGTYTNPTVGVDAYGRVVSIANGNVSGTVTSVGITPGAGIQVSGGPITSSGNITIQNTGVTRLSAGSGINLSGSNGNVTVSVAPTSGIVTYVGLTSNSLSVTGSPITSSGTFTVDIPNSFNKTITYQPQWLYHGAQLGSTSSLAFSSNGLHVLIGASASSVIYKYTLTTAWDLSTGSYSGQSYDVSAQTTGVRSLRFSVDGTKFYAASSTTDTVLQYGMATAYNLSTASYSSSVSVASQETEIRGLEFKYDGLRMYIIGNTNKRVYQYNLSTAWDVSSATYSGSSSPVVNTTTPQGLVINPDGTRMFILGQGQGSEIEQYNMTAWNITTATYTDRFDGFSYYESIPTDIAISADGTQIYTCGNTPLWYRIWAFKFTTPYDISIYSRNPIIVGSKDNKSSTIAIRDNDGNINITGATLTGNILSTAGRFGLGYLYDNTNMTLGAALTGGANVWSISNEGIIANTVTSSAYYDAVYNSTANNTSIGNIFNYIASKGSWGSGTTVTNQYGFFASGVLTGATNNYGFYGNIASGANQYNLYMNGTATNYFAGDTIIGNTNTIPTGYTSQLTVRVSSSSKNALTLHNASGSTSEGPMLYFSKDRANAIVQNGDVLGRLRFSGWDGSSYDIAAQIRAEVDGSPAAGDMPGRILFSTTPPGSSSPIERCRINANGSFLINTSSDTNNYKVIAQSSSTNGYEWRDTASSGSTNNGFASRFTQASGTGFTHFQGISNSTIVFRVLGNGDLQNTNNSYGAISDLKLKENITDATAKLNDLLQVRVVNFNFKSEPNNKQLGVIAQELEEIFPGLVESTPDYTTITKTREVQIPAEYDDLGNQISPASSTIEEYTEKIHTGEFTKSVKYSVFVPMLIKALQEQNAQIQSLTTRLSNLEQK